MTASSLIVIADRGGLKAYRVHETPTRGPALELVQAFRIPNVNDFSRTNHTTATTDWPQLETEESRRICKQLADEITKLVRRIAVEGWSLAAPESIYREIVHFLPVEVRERIIEHVESDLLKTPVARLPDYFRSLQPI
jgi:Protein required for attachment to host cells